MNEKLLHEWFSFLPESLEKAMVWCASWFTGEGWHMTQGVVFMLVIIFLPGGLVEGSEKLTKRRKGKSADDAATKQPAE